MTPTILHTFESGLADAAAALRSTRRRDALAVAGDRLAYGIAITGLCVGGSAIVTAVAGGPTAIAPAIAMLGVLTSIGVTLPTLYSGWTARPNWDEVAQRLDLAARNRNAIATGLEFSRQQASSPFAANAVAAGLHALSQARQTTPITEPVPMRLGRKLGLTALGLAAASLTWVVTTPLVPDRLAAAKPQASVIPHALSAPPSPEPVEQPDAPKNDPPRAGPSAARAETAPSKATSEPAERGKTAPNADAAASAAASSARAGESPADAAADRKQPPSPARPHTESSAAESAKSAPGASASSAASQSRPSQSAPQTGTGANPASPNDQDEQANDTTNDAANKAVASIPPATEELVKGQPGGEGGDKENKDAKRTTNTGSNNSQAEGNAGGNGQSSGQNAPKKSRGVAPMLLGTRQPDLIQGRQLPGPDERTTRQVPPKPNPEPSAASIPPQPNATHEKPVSIFDIPTTDRNAVNQYFQQFHATPDDASRSAVQ